MRRFSFLICFMLGVVGVSAESVAKATQPKSAAPTSAASVSQVWETALSDLRARHLDSALSGFRRLCEYAPEGLQAAGVDPQEVWVIAAYAAYRAGAWSELELWSARVADAALSPEARAISLWTQSHLALQEHQWTLAGDTFSRLLALSSPFQESAHLARFSALKAAKEWPAAKAALAALIQAYPNALSPERRLFERARIDLELGHIQVAIDTLRNLYVQSPHFEADAQVETLLKQQAAHLKTAFPKLLTAEAWKRRIDTALEKGVADAAQAAFQVLLEAYSHALTSDYQRKTEAEIAFKRRDYAQASRLFAEALDHAPSQTERLFAMGRLATSYARSEQVDLAIATNRTLIALSPQSASANWARYKVAFLQMDQGKLDEATSAFGQVAKSKFKPVYKDALWYAGWCAYQLGRYERARTYWAELALVDLPSRWRAIYWQARSFEKEGKLAEASSRYQVLSETARIEYYGVLALLKLQNKTNHWRILPDDAGWWGTIPSQMDGKSLSLAHVEDSPSPAFRRAAYYITRGIDEAVPGTLSAVETEVVGKRAVASDGLLNYLNLAWQGDAYHRAFSLALTHKAKLKASFPQFDQQIFQFVYPQAWSSWVQTYATQVMIEPALAYAIMRQESVFQPAVRSPANAVGLMQLIAPTARSVAKDSGLADFDLADLTRPEINIRLGTSYLGSLSQKFNDVLPYVIASYNAGPEAVTRWLAAGHYTAETWDEFVEAIPYSETNHYVKKVLMNYWMYRRLYNL